MKNIILKGGLGNQIFQYAFANYVRDQGFEVCLNSKSLLSTGRANDFLDEIFFDVKIHGKRINKNNGVDNNPLLKCYRILKEVFSINKVYKENVEKSISLQELESFNTFNGYWQSTKYIKKFKINLNPRNIIFQEIFPEERSGYLAMHLRLGDYSKPKNQMIHGTMPMKYYEKALLHIISRKKIRKLILFSDSPIIAKEKIKKLLIKNELITVIDFESFPFKDFEDFEEMYLMSLFENLIISNSTFSYWSAILGNSSKTVIAPNIWYADKSMQEILAPRLRQNLWTYL